MSPSRFHGAEEDNRGRCTDNPAGCHPIWTIGATISNIPTIFTPDVLAVATSKFILAYNKH